MNSMIQSTKIVNNEGMIIRSRSQTMDIKKRADPKEGSALKYYNTIYRIC